MSILPLFNFLSTTSQYPIEHQYRYTQEYFGHIVELTADTNTISVYNVKKNQHVLSYAFCKNSVLHFRLDVDICIITDNVDVVVIGKFRCGNVTSGETCFQHAYAFKNKIYRDFLCGTLIIFTDGTSANCSKEGLGNVINSKDLLYKLDIESRSSTHTIYTYQIDRYECFFKKDNRCSDMYLVNTDDPVIFNNEQCHKLDNQQRWSNWIQNRNPSSPCFITWSDMSEFSTLQRIASFLDNGIMGMRHVDIVPCIERLLEKANKLKLLN